MIQARGRGFKQLVNLPKSGTGLTTESTERTEKPVTVKNESPPPCTCQFRFGLRVRPPCSLCPPWFYRRPGTEPPRTPRNTDSTRRHDEPGESGVNTKAQRHKPKEPRNQESKQPTTKAQRTQRLGNPGLPRFPRKLGTLPVSAGTAPVSFRETRGCPQRVRGCPRSFRCCPKGFRLRRLGF
jgi:hypothetical protein